MALAYHEPFGELSDDAREIHRALSTVIEELEAVAWYHQRSEVSTDDALKGIMIHNRDEEIEHACMAIEWLRRNMDGWDENLKTYLFTEVDITSLEEGEEEAEEPGSGDLGIGKLKEEA